MAIIPSFSCAFLGALFAASNRSLPTNLVDLVYVLTIVLGMLAWILGCIVAAQRKEWGWFIFVLIIPMVGALIYVWTVADEMG